MQAPPPFIRGTAESRTLSADGWLLVTLHFTGPVPRRDPAAWRSVVATADWINHAILSYEEVSTGVRALARRGLLVERAGSVLVLSAAARKGFAAAYGTRKRMSVFKLWDAADALIAGRKVGPSAVRGPTRAVYERALQSYGVTLPVRP